MLIALLLAVLVAVLLAACGSDDDGSDAETAEAGDAQPALTEDDFTGPEQGLPTDYDLDLEPGACEGVTIGYQNIADTPISKFSLRMIEQGSKHLGNKLVVVHDRANPDQQVTNTRQLIAQGVDALIMAPLDPNAMLPLLERADREGIKLFGWDAILADQDPLPGMVTANITGWERTPFEQIREMARIAPGGKIALLNLALPLPQFARWEERAKEYAKKAGLEVVATVAAPADTEASATETILPVLSREPDLDGVVAINDQLALGASAAARQNQRDIATIGTNGADNAFEAIEEGQLTATLQRQDPQITLNLLEAACAVATGQVSEDEIPPLVLTPSRLVNADTLDEVPTHGEQVAEYEAEVGSGQ